MLKAKNGFKNHYLYQELKEMNFYLAFYSTNIDLFVSGRNLFMHNGHIPKTQASPLV